MNCLKLVLCVIVFIGLESFECSTSMTKAELIAKQGVYAIMPPDFEYDFKFRVLSYDWIYKGKGDAYSGTSNGSKYPEALIQHIKQGSPKDILIIENVKVIGDDNLVRLIGGLTVVVK